MYFKNIKEIFHEDTEATINNEVRFQEITEVMSSENFRVNEKVMANIDLVHKGTLYTESFKYPIENINEKLKKYECEDCKNLFIAEISLKYHISNNLCHKKRLLDEKIQFHEIELEANDDNQKCKFCEKTYCTSSDLQSHVKSVHEGVNFHVCFICEMSFNRPSLLAKHVNEDHSQIHDKPFKCSYCKKSFEKSSHLKA